MKIRHWCVLILLTVAVVTVITMDTGSARSEPPLIKGTYGITFTGIVLPSGTLESGVGIFVADGQGRLTGTEVFNSGGRVCANVAVTATYMVGANGIGALDAVVASQTPGCAGTFRTSLLVLDGGKLVRAVSTGADFVTISEEWRRQSD